MTSNPTEQQLTLSVSKESLTFQYLVPEAGRYLGVRASFGKITFSAPLRLTGIQESYHIPDDGARAPFCVIRFAPDGKYVIEDAPSFNVELPHESVFDVSPGTYLGSVTGSTVTFTAPVSRRGLYEHHTLLPGGEAVKGVDIPALIHINRPTVVHSAQEN